MAGIDFTSVETIISSVSWWSGPSDTWGNGAVNSDIPFTDGQKLTIAQCLMTLHNLQLAGDPTDPTFIANNDILNKIQDGLANEGLQIFQTNSDDAGRGFYNSSPGLLGLNLGGIAGLQYFDPTGYFIHDNPVAVVAHELSHAFAGTLDYPSLPLLPNGGEQKPTNADWNDPSFDMNGQAVNFTNYIDASLGLAGQQRMSYASELVSSDPRVAELNPNISYTNGEPVSIVRYGDWYLAGSHNPDPSGVTSVNDNIDMSGRSDNELVFGFSGNDIITTGNGNDFLYGGDGDDVFSGGGGNNFIDGTMPGLAPSPDQIDTVSYAASANNGPSLGAVVSLDGGASDPIYQGKSEITVDNGYVNATGTDGTDSLYSIEKSQA